MWRIRRLFVANILAGGLRRPKGYTIRSFLSTSFAPLRSPHRTPSSPPRLLPTFLSTAATPAPPRRVSPTTAQPLPPSRVRPHPLDCCYRLHRGHCTCPTTRASVATHWGPRNRLAAAILVLHHDCTIGFHYAVLCPPACQVLLQEHFASVCFKCFRCFRGMLQGFQIDVAKVDWMLHMLQWLYMYVLSVCSIWPRYMLEVFLSVYCKSSSGCCIYMHVASIYFKCFKVFHVTPRVLVTGSAVRSDLNKLCQVVTICEVNSSSMSHNLKFVCMLIFFKVCMNSDNHVLCIWVN
jgi:hypothetical protein